MKFEKELENLFNKYSHPMKGDSCICSNDVGFFIFHEDSEEFTEYDFLNKMAELVPSNFGITVELKKYSALVNNYFYFVIRYSDPKMKKVEWK